MSCPTDFYFKHITYFKVSFVYIASFTIQVILMQLYSDKQENKIQWCKQNLILL